MAREESEAMSEAHSRVDRKDCILPQGRGNCRGLRPEHVCSDGPLSAEEHGDNAHHAMPDWSGRLAYETFPPQDCPVALQHLEPLFGGEAPPLGKVSHSLILTISGYPMGLSLYNPASWS